MYSLSLDEKDKLNKGIQAAYAVPFIDDLEDFIWEAIFSYVKKIPIIDPLNSIRRKLLYDVVDPAKSVGWSLKSVQWSVKPKCNFELVIQRADIFKKSKDLGFSELNLNSEPAMLGQALLEHWYTYKVHHDANVQQVKDKRICILLKSKDRKTYAYFEDQIAQYNYNELEWVWTNSLKTGLQGIRKSDGHQIFRWYPNQKQFFERFALPLNAYIFSIQPQRMGIEETINLLVNNLSKPS